MADPSSKCINHAHGPDGRCIVCSMLDTVRTVQLSDGKVPPWVAEHYGRDVADRMNAAQAPDTVATVPRPRGELNPTRARRLARLIKVRSDADAAIRAEVLLALTEDEASFREVSDLTGLSTNTLQRWKREAT